MRYYFLLLIISCGFSCNEIDKNSFSLVLEIKKINPVQNISTVNFILSNNSNNSIDSKNWSMFWSQMYGSIDNNSLPEGVSFESINGDYKRLNFKNVQLKKIHPLSLNF